MRVFQSVRGMPDILPASALRWQRFERCWREVAIAYGYQEIRLPLVENTALFKRSIGDVTDIVEKEMFTLPTKDNESLSLRPEGTASCVRAGIEHNLLYHQVQRLWYMGPMFRYERPQKGRYRQFHQVGVEAFGLEGPDIEIEHILLMNRLWKKLGIESMVTLQVNSLGDHADRARYREKLVDYFSRYVDDLDTDCKRRLQTNPLRILDSKNPELAELIENAPKASDHLGKEAKSHFMTLLRGLTDANIAFEVNPRLVRGLDYYNLTVYEWVTDKLGAQGAVCAGGRYNDLVSQLGGNATPAVGFALGIERVLLLQETLGHTENAGIDAYVIHSGDVDWQKVTQLAEEWREALPQLSVVVHCGGGNFKQQFKKADKSGAKLALILGEDELNAGKVGVKFLRETAEQRVLLNTEVLPFLIDYLENAKVE